MRSVRTAVAVLTGLMLLGAVGCANPEKQQLADLRQEYDLVAGQNKTLQDELARCRGGEADALTQLQAARADIRQRDMTIADLRTQLAAKPATVVVQQPKTETATGWEKGEFGDRVTVGSDILFNSGRATLTDAGTKALDQIASTLKSQYAGKQVRVIGYTDNDPITKTKTLWEDNLDLSANRAMTVVRHLRAKGVAADTVEAVARGDTRPVVANTSAANKAKNRRVEIIVVK